jgi:D-alanine--poly(phosphoribitol) ligase subunit 2
VSDAIIERLCAIFVESLHIEAPPPDVDLFENGIVDSLQLVELLVQLEQRFGFKIKIDELDLDDLRTLARIAALVAARTGTKRVSPISPTRGSVPSKRALRSGGAG